MVKKTTKSQIARKLGKAFQNHAGDETVRGAGFIDLPPGIQNGVAKLVEAKLGTYKSGANEGEQFVYLAGVVQAPSEVTYIPKVFQDGKVQVLPTQTVSVKGQRTSSMFPLCDTTNASGEVKEVDAHVENFLVELRSLGVDTSDVDETNLEETLNDVKEAGIFFKFSTSASDPTSNYPEPRVWENWHGSDGLEDYEPEDEEEVVDNTGDSKEEPEEKEEPETTDKTLGELADEGDDAAQVELTEQADKKGIDPDKYVDWSGVEDALAEAEEGGDSEEADSSEETPETEPPSKGQWFAFKPPRARKLVDVEVTTSNRTKKTCTIKCESTGKTYKDVPWDSLSELEE